MPWPGLNSGVSDRGPTGQARDRALLLAAGALVAAGSSMIPLGVAGPERLVPPV